MRKITYVLAPLGLALLLAASLFVPGVALADDDGYTGSGGGSFGWVPNTNWSGFDIYIGSVYESLYGGGGAGGGHAFGEDGYYGSGGGTFSGKPVESGEETSNEPTLPAGQALTENTLTLSNSKYKFKSGTWQDFGSYTVKVNFNDTVRNAINAKLATYPYFICIFYYHKTQNTFYLQFIMSQQPLTVSDVYYEGSGDNTTYTINLSGESAVKYICQSNGNPTKTIGSGEINVSWTANPTFGNTCNSSNTTTKLDNRISGYAYFGNGANSVPAGESGGGEEEEPYTYPSDNPDYPDPTTYTEPDTTLPTIGDQTETTVDLSPVTDRQDITNTLLYGVGSDLGNLYNMVWSEFDQFEAEIYDLGDYLGRLMYLDVVMGMQSNDLLYQINEGIAGLDQDTDAIDLTGINTRLDTLILSLGDLTNYDDTGLIASITGSGGTDLLGLYGRLDTVLNWLDAYTGYDDSGLIDAINGAVYDDANLITTIENAAYDDSSLVNAIVGSHGVDVLGLFGRLDTISNWLDAYTGFDDAELLTLVENIYDAINNFQDENTAVTTIRGDVRLIADRLGVVNDWLEDYAGYDDADLMSDVAIIRSSSVDAVSVLNSVDESLQLLVDELTLSTSGYGIATIRSYISGIHSFVSSTEQYVHSMLDELQNYTNDFVSYWSAVVAKLDSVIAAIERIGTHEPRQYPSLPTDGDDYNVYDDVLHLGELQDALSRLMAKFPFSVVSDISLIFAALVRPAEAPVFSVPVPNPSDWGSPHYLTVDLSQFDVVASVLRVGLVLWAIARVSRRTLNLWTREE